MKREFAIGFLALGAAGARITTARPASTRYRPSPIRALAWAIVAGPAGSLHRSAPGSI
jgi:hypothetical protein